MNNNYDYLILKLLEASREMKEGKAKNQIAMGPTGKHTQNREDTVTAEEGSTGQRVLEDSCGWPKKTNIEIIPMYISFSCKVNKAFC